MLLLQKTFLFWSQGHCISWKDNYLEVVDLSYWYKKLWTPEPDNFMVNQQKSIQIWRVSEELIPIQAIKY
jgi:hypothetical protein